MDGIQATSSRVSDEDSVKILCCINALQGATISPPKQDKKKNSAKHIYTCQSI